MPAKIAPSWARVEALLQKARKYERQGREMSSRPGAAMSPANRAHAKADRDLARRYRAQADAMARLLTPEQYLEETTR